MSDPQPTPAITIRAARPDEAATLSELAFRSKTFWGYDAAFMEACRADLTVAPEDMGRRTVCVALAEQEIVGFYELDGQGQRGELLDLFVAPGWIGRGVGGRLWQHAMEQARAQGFHEIEVQSDPYAEPFYRAMGAQRVGERESTVFAGRMLPLMRYKV